MNDTPARETVKIDGVDHDIQSMSDRGRHYLEQIRECTRTTSELQLKIERSEVCRVGFVNLLKEELDSPAAATTETEEEAPDE